MSTPFPGMDPWLEHPALWPDVHNRLIASIGDSLSPAVAPRYYVALEQRTYVLDPGDLELIFLGRPDLSVVTDTGAGEVAGTQDPARRTAAIEVEVPVADEVRETYLEIRGTRDHEVATILEILSPVNKIHPRGRREYETKRLTAFSTRTNMVEIDLLRSGEPMPLQGEVPASDYRILVSRGIRRPRARLFVLSVRDRLPEIPIPLLPGDEEPTVDVGAVLHGVYERARYDLRIDYTQPPVPPLREEDVHWASRILLAS